MFVFREKPNCQNEDQTINRYTVGELEDPLKGIQTILVVPF